MAIPNLPLQVAEAWAAYMVDAAQRSVLFLDLLRRRGDQQIEITADPEATVLLFAHELVLSGRTLARPIDYSLYRILPRPGTPTDPAKRPVVVIDPRAGQSAGIGGFKPESEIGDALAAGHPVYFIAFGAKPEPGQTFLDVVEGQVAFFERVVALHPGLPRPAAIGNCQAGYQMLMTAMLRPDLFGPCLVVGSPMSYWQGVRGKGPMRYLGGLLGGSWLTALTSDLGHGHFDGAWLILNFDALGPANFLWDKQYDIYMDVDQGAARYLSFEKWWGDFVPMNGEEMQYLVDNLFVGDRLARGRLASPRGGVFDLRAVTSPIVVLTSRRDDISPPPQTLGWILDVYRDIEEIRSAGRTIVYSADAQAGHLGLFVSTKVADKEDEEFILAIDAIERLPPGLYEMVISPAARGWSVAFEPRSLDDVRAFGRNSPQDDRAFAAAARLSEINLALYRALLQPAVQSLASEPMAELARTLHPLRLSYTLFSSWNPWMAVAASLAAGVAGHRRPVTTGNPFLEMQKATSLTISSAIDICRGVRDDWMEQLFFAVYGSAPLQSWLAPAAAEAP